ncbi:MAG TPA: phage tail sheath protein [Myxococcales bacterium]|nr:phage tail sheath protein [Myxococcales bacterium]
MQGLTFEVEERVAPSAPERADVACFVGYVRRRPDAPASPAIQRFLFEAGWTRAPLDRVDPEDPLDPLVDVPLPFESFDAFDRHFAWEQRSSVEEDGASYLGTSVRSFFAQGGRKCYVVRLGDPPAVDASRAARAAAIPPLLPAAATAVERSTWSGAAHLFGLDDVSFLAFPDLPELTSVDAEPLPLPHPPPPSDPIFVECADEPDAGQPQWHQPERTAPRSDLAGYQAWGTFLRRVRDLIRQSRGHLREVHLVAALPRPALDLQVELPGGKRVAAEHDLGRYLQQNGVLAQFESAFVQLAYPWGRTSGSDGLPEQVEPLDGVLVGTLARNALMRGTFRSSVGLALAEVLEVRPVPTRLDQALNGPGVTPRGLVERVSLIGPTPRGMRVLSDVTTSPQEAHRMAPASRLMAVVLRAARHAGLEQAFEPSSPATWKALRRRLERLLTRLYEAGALRGASAAEAFEVRCDRTTMTQDDLDNGRLIATIVLDPAAALERLQVMLAVAENGVAVAQGGGA